MPLALCCIAVVSILDALDHAADQGGACSAAGPASAPGLWPWEAPAGRTPSHEKQAPLINCAHSIARDDAITGIGRWWAAVHPSFADG